MRARLIVIAGKASPAVCELIPDHIIRLGRRGTNHVVVGDRHASREHAELYHDESGSWMLRDCPAITNPTRVDGQKIEAPTRLSHGQVISIGETRLQFAQDSATVSMVHGAEDSSSTDTTGLHTDELETLVAYLLAAQNELSPTELIRLALTAVLRQTRATLCGFLSLDPVDPLPRIVLPSTSRVDQPLSQRLTQKALDTGRPAWLGAPGSPAESTESLASFRDAVCVPLRPTTPADSAAATPPLGALHVYKLNQSFTEREVRFCEVLTRCLASNLLVLLSRRVLEADNERLRKCSIDLGHDLIGNSPCMRDLRAKVARLAPQPYSVLITGESGVGKELVAQALHQGSGRRDGPFVAVNCATIVGSMAESQLFGHVKGSFTSAISNQMGYFEQADLGTLFLDEIGELPLELQAKLLRVLELRTFYRVGDKETMSVDVRIIAATNRDLAADVRAQKFRADLWHRLGVPLQVAPLRERREDVPALAAYLLERENARTNRRVRLTPAALERLMAYHWPGNVRELRTVLEHTLALTPGDLIQAEDLQLKPTAPADQVNLPLNLTRLEEFGIRRVLILTGWNNTAAARLLGINRGTLIEKVRRYDIRRDQCGPGECDQTGSDNPVAG